MFRNLLDRKKLLVPAWVIAKQNRSQESGQSQDLDRSQELDQESGRGQELDQDQASDRGRKTGQSLALALQGVCPGIPA